jgi:putative PIN family toxin of toxin-antitoxin system
VTAGFTRNWRALLDANILVSILVSPDSSRSAAAAILERAEEAQFTAVVSVEVIQEVERVALEKPWLSHHVRPGDVERLVRALNRIAEVVPRLEDVPPRICRDPSDDYLVAQAVLSRVDLLVSRDRDLLALGDVAGVRIVDPVTFLAMLRSTEHETR